MFFAIAFLVTALTGNNDARYEYPVKVTGIHDGDTIVVDFDLGLGLWLHGQRVRLYGLDAPELNTNPGIQAKNSLQALIADHDVTVETISDKKDKYGRWLGRIWIKGTGDWCSAGSWCNANEWLVTNGYAKPYYGSSKKKEGLGQE